MAVPCILLKHTGKNVSEDPANCRQYVKEQVIGKAAPSFEEQTNYVACLDQRGEKNDDAITDCRKTKCMKQRFKAKDE